MTLNLKEKSGRRRKRGTELISEKFEVAAGWLMRGPVGALTVFAAVEDGAALGAFFQRKRRCPVVDVVRFFATAVGADALVS